MDNSNSIIRSGAFVNLISFLKSIALLSLSEISLTSKEQIKQPSISFNNSFNNSLKNSKIRKFEDSPPHVHVYSIVLKSRLKGKIDRKFDEDEKKR